MDDKILKHLEFIQNTINRMSTNSFIIKGWAIALVGIILGLNKLEGNYIFKKTVCLSGIKSTFTPSR